MSSSLRSRVHVLASVIAGLTFISPVVAEAQPDQRPPTPVSIVAPVPVPVSGVVTIDGEGSVKVTNPATDPVLIRDVDRSVSEPFSHRFTISAAACGCTNCCFLETAPIPDGMRLVIEHVSGFVGLTAAGNLGPVQLQERDGTTSTLPLLLLPATARTHWNGVDYPAYEFSETVKAFVNSGKTVRLSIFGSTSWSTLGQIVVTGQLVPAP